MASSYDAMWEKLNLDLDAHAGLLQVLGKFYGDIYMSQQGRLRGMEYLDFVLSEVHGLRIKELQDAKASGKKIVGTFCVFVPEEIVLAAGGIQVGLCAGAEIGKGEAEKVLPRNTCALIKSFVGFKLGKALPVHRIMRPYRGRNHLRRQEKGLRNLFRLFSGLCDGNSPDEKRLLTGNCGKVKSCASRAR